MGGLGGPPKLPDARQRPGKAVALLDIPDAPRYWSSRMKIVPLAAESLGVRSMATYVEVGATSVLIDPGATLAPLRYGLPPADEEWEALRRANDRISAYAARSQFIFVSH